MSTEINYIFGFCVVYTEKNYLHITVGENIKQRLKDYFLMKKKIKSFHSGLVILLGFSFSFSLQSTKYFGKFTLTPKTSVFYQTLEDFGWVTKKFIWSPLWLCNILMDPFPSPPFHWQLIGSQFSIVPSVIRCWWRLIPHSVPLENYVTSPKNAPLPPLRKCIMTLPRVLSILRLLTHKYLP